ncbi:M13 family peptidase [Candidatus Saccharibacteria bacterium]|nr:M13 family peptidase [Candidatus Saccharibacteria bacterium]
MQKIIFDTKTRPQDDFYGYVNNFWLAKNPIPASETRWGTFDILRDNSWRAVHEIVNDLTAMDTREITRDQQTLKRFFESALTFDSHGQNHIDSLLVEKQLIDEVSTQSDIARLIGRHHRLGLAPLFTEYTELDDKNSQMQVLRIHQAGLSLPNRDYYLEADTRMVKIRTAYTNHLETIGKVVGNLAPKKSKEIIDFETKLAKASWTDVELRDVQRNYTRMTLAELEKRYASFDWTAFFDGLGWKKPSDHIVVDQPTYLDAMFGLLDKTPIEIIKEYLNWHLLNGFVSWIDQAGSDKNFAFYGMILGGMKQQKPLWKRATILADSLVIGEALGREYATRHFPESSKLAVTELVNQIREAYHVRIDRLTWMKPDTKKLAHRKLNNIKVFVGYPSKWKDLSSLDFSQNNLIANLMQARELNTDIELAKIGTPPPNEEWYMNAQTVNAYNHPNRLEIVFPAAILQPPFYDPTASQATNLGGIGAVIGHELTHGFDDQGAQYDEQGNTNQWISDNELKSFTSLADNIVRQADAFEAAPGIFLQGKLILGEAIADIGGLALAVEALEHSATPKEFQSSLPDLFVNFARCECGATRLERAIELAKTDPHPPSPFRVNYVVCHIDTFYEAYDVTETDKLYLPPENRAKIW